jgi:transcription initiation factor TFIIIB Brf1 subunit/transcription initiation factor TFIIB
MIDNFIGKKCFGCFSVDLVLDFKAGDIICRNCGEIVSDRCIDEGNEVLSYSDGDGKSQASRSSGMVDMFGCMQTMFVNGPESLRKSLEKAQQMSSDKKEKSVFGNLNVLNEMCAKLNLIRTIQVSQSNFWID